ncbi:MAG: hypothetical protein QOH43_1671 [Solirubrobacteraceae bacterium]|nr:hypothetical protein [Solirubrobacteraceae bacterium]
MPDAARPRPPVRALPAGAASSLARMTDGDDATVTPSGVRDGDPEALEAVVARRGPAVLAFCQAACGPETAVRVAAEAFARFRAAVVAAPDAATLVPDELLLGATRHAAASFAQVTPAGGGVRRVLGRPVGPNPCADVPAMLAARAEASLTPADLQRLARHLDRCAGCKWLESAFSGAEAAFRSPPEGPPPEQAAATILAAMRAAAPVGPGAAVAGLEQFSLPGHVPEPALAGAAAGPAAAGIRPAGAGPTPVAAPEAGGGRHIVAPQGHELPRPARPEPDLGGVGPFLRWILPGATVLAGVLGAMAVAGVL